MRFEFLKWSPHVVPVLSYKSFSPPGIGINSFSPSCLVLRVQISLSVSTATWQRSGRYGEKDDVSVAAAEIAS